MITQKETEAVVRRSLKTDPSSPECSALGDSEGPRVAGPWGAPAFLNSEGTVTLEAERTIQSHQAKQGLCTGCQSALGTPLLPAFKVRHLSGEWPGQQPGAAPSDSEPEAPRRETNPRVRDRELARTTAGLDPRLEVSLWGQRLEREGLRGWPRPGGWQSQLCVSSWGQEEVGSELKEKQLC